MSIRCARHVGPARYSGWEVKVYRQALGMTQAQFGELYGVTTRTVERWERNGVRTDRIPDRRARLDAIWAGSLAILMEDYKQFDRSISQDLGYASLALLQDPNLRLS